MANLEQNGEKKQVEKDFTLQETNLMQFKLSKDSGKGISDWIQENGENFRKIIDARPDLVNLYRASQEKTLEFIKEELEKMKTGRSN